jgi:sirohydrochlorin ferrochelatase
VSAPERALLLIDHGSRRAAANRRLGEVAASLAARLGSEVHVEAAHLEIAEPSIAEGFAACVRAGAREVVAVPYFLSPGRHADEDVPREVAAAAEAHPDVRYRVAPPLGPDELLLQLIVKRAQL